jgi:hypothetical protein
MDMTIEKLEAYRGLTSEMQALSQQITSLYDTYRSPQLMSNGSHSMSAGSPVETAVNKVLELKTVYEQKYEEAANLLYNIETWLAQIEDPEIRSIARFHYVLGYSWQRTNVAVYGYSSYYAARKRLMRYLGKEA